MSKKAKVVRNFEEIDGVVDIFGDLYCKTQEALDKLLACLRKDGYEVKSIREDKYALEHTTQERMETMRTYLWYASCGDATFGLSIFEAWRWAPLAPSPKLHEEIIHAARQVSRQDYYHQDGRPAFNRRIFEAMGKFVRHFTALDGDAWDRAVKHFRLDGPGCIEDVARFCHPEAQVRNEPNMFNLLETAFKVGKGQPVTEREIASANLAWNDPEERQEFEGLLRQL